ncbi:MAG: LPS assembly lipoprotein LptE [Dongiaceae bacterium]
MYGERGTAGAAVTADLATIRIAAMPDRIGQQVYNMLRERLNPHGRPADPRYVLSVTLSETRENLFLEEDETATRANLTLRATYVLRRADKDEVVVQGTTRSVSSYDILSSQFATIVSEEDARTRSARAISDDIRTRLALALSGDGAS